MFNLLKSFGYIYFSIHYVIEYYDKTIKEIVEIVKSLKSPDLDEFHRKESQTKLNWLIFVLYDLIYYDQTQVEHYFTEKTKANALVRKRDIQRYCDEFIDSFKPFIEELFLNAEWATSKLFGTMVRFSLSESERPFQYNKELEQFIKIIETYRKDCTKEDIFKEKTIKFYDDDQLYIYKSNKLRDWTEFMAIVDANEELHKHFKMLSDNT